MSERELQEAHELIGTVLAVRDDEREDRATTEDLLDAVAGLERARELIGNVLSEHGGCITRFYHNGGQPGTTTLTVQDLMDENGDFEDSAWTYLQDILEHGHYDDSDWGSEVFCYYMPTDGLDRILAEAREWYTANPSIVADLNLDDPATWVVGE